MKRKSGERGTVVLMTALLLPVLIFLMGLAVDFGIMYAVRNSTQNAADAAATAGVYAYVGLDPMYVSGSYASAATKAADANPVFGGSTGTIDSIVAGPCNPPPVDPGAPGTPDSYGVTAQCVKVTMHSYSPLFFAKVFGKTPVLVNVTATAQANEGGLGPSPDCAKPIFVPDPATLSPPVPVNGTMTIHACTVGSKDPSCQGPASSQFMSLDFSSLINPYNPKPDPIVFSDASSVTNGGTNAYDNSWEKCVRTAVHCGTVVNVQTGNQGSNTNTDIKQLAQGPPPVTSIVAPMWTPSAIVPGNNNLVVVDGFILLDNLTCPSNGYCTARYVQKLNCNLSGGYGNQFGSYTTPVRLIQ